MINSFVRCLFLILLSHVGLRPIQALAVDAPQGVPAHPCGACFAVAADGQRTFVALESTEVLLTVQPGLVEAEVIQTFVNRTDTALEAIYVYPLPHEATLTSFELRCADRVVRSVVKEKAAARATYAAARSEGRKTALLEQEDPSIFQTSVANFLPGETVSVVLRYIQPVRLAAGTTEIVFPMVSDDRYAPHAEAGTAEGIAERSSPRVRMGLDHAEEATRSTVYAFDIEIAGFPGAAIHSPSHAVRVSPVPGSERVAVALAEEIAVPDRDFILRIESTPSLATRSSLVSQRTPTGEYGVLTVFPPTTRLVSGQAARSRDVVFLVDRSGSMRGSRFTSLQRGLEACIQALVPDDRFQIIAFNDLAAAFRPGWTRADGREVDAALQYVRSLWAGGGTEMAPALGQALQASSDDSRDNIVIFLTDGSVTNQDELLRIVEAGAGQTRLFAFGVGAAPNRALLERLADLGHGQARFITDDDSIDRAMTDLFESLDAPVLSEVRVSLVDERGEPLADASFLPESPRDVYAGRPIQVAYRATNVSPAAVVIEGREDGIAARHEVALDGERLRGDGLEKHFGARWVARLDDLLRNALSEPERELIRKEIIETALQFQLVTAYTSRVAVDDRRSREAADPLRSEHIAAAVVADDGRSDADPASGVYDSSVEGDMIVLSPFCVSAESEMVYTASTTLAGSRLCTELRDLASAIHVVADGLIDDLGANAAEDLSRLFPEALQRADLARAGNGTGMVDGLPVATIVDIASISRVSVRTSGTAWSEVERRAGSIRRSTILDAEINDDGDASFTARWTGGLAGETRAPGLFQGTWRNLDGQSRVSALADVALSWDAWKVRLRGSGADFCGYGDTGMVSASLTRRLGDASGIGAELAFHRLDRDDPRQFQLGETDPTYAGLGMFNLDLLTANTRGLTDVVARIEGGGTYDLAGIRHVVSLMATLHRQTSAWLAEWEGVPMPGERLNFGPTAGYTIRFPHDRLSLQLEGATLTHRTPGTGKSEVATSAGSVGASIRVNGTLSVFGHVSSDEILPWVDTGRFNLSPGQRASPVAPDVEARRKSQVGLKCDALDDRVIAQVAWFVDESRGHVYRDWAWERDHTGAAWEIEGSRVRLPVGTRTWGRMVREGWLGSLEMTPMRGFTAVATGSWARQTQAGPFRGGNHVASLAWRYDFQGGGLRGWMLGGVWSACDRMTYEDGLSIPGGSRWDLMVGYSGLRIGSSEGTIRLRVANLGDRVWRATRFAPERGREITLSHTQSF